MAGSEPYPLTFEPILKSKVWGGRRLERYGKTLPAGASVGESWEVSDLGATSASGGGGGAARSVIANGPLSGRTLGEAMGSWGVGLDAQEHLSVQTHPSPAYAARRPSAHLKTECWYVVEASPGSVIFKGLAEGATEEDFRRALGAGEVDSVLARVEARVGECHNLPSGTIHALGAGVLVAEAQTPSDTTFRLYDWTREYGREVREMHEEEGLASAVFEAAPVATRRPEGESGPYRLVETEFFTVDEARAGEGIDTGGDAPVVLMTVAGRGEVVSDEGSFEPVAARAGRTVLVPASCGRGIRISGVEQLRVLAIEVR